MTRIADIPTEPVGFANFWHWVPIKRDRKYAMKCYAKALKDVIKTHGLTEAGAADYLRQKMERFYHSPSGKTAGNFCPRASTWLNRGSYDDDPAEWWPDQPNRTDDAVSEVLTRMENRDHGPRSLSQDNQPLLVDVRQKA